MSAVTPLKRTAIIVTDLRRSLKFYRDVLGMNVWVQGKAGRELPALFRLLGAPPCTTRWVILQSEDVDWGMVGLFELSRPAPPTDACVFTAADMVSITVVPVKVLEVKASVVVAVEPASALKTRSPLPSTVPVKLSAPVPAPEVATVAAAVPPEISVPA